jgi:hypothetical protein
MIGPLDFTVPVIILVTFIVLVIEGEV